MITQDADPAPEFRRERTFFVPNLRELRTRLIEALRSAVVASNLSQVRAARLCHTDQPTLSKVLRERTDSVTVDKLIQWLLALGQSVELRVGPTTSRQDDSAERQTVVSGAKSRWSNAQKRAESRPIYLDHHATTPVDDRVLKVIVDVTVRDFGNANSPDHTYGEAAWGIVDHARGQVASLVGAEAADVRFTSGSTESLRLALSHAQAVGTGASLRVALSKVEHPALIDFVANAARKNAVSVRWIDVDQKARLIETSLEAALRFGVDLVCVMAANNEVGTIYPVASIAARVHEYGAAILVDATQAAGRVEIRAREWGVDYLVLSAHKLYGPKGVGALVMQGVDDQGTRALLGHAGTPNVPGIAGFGKACELRQLEMAVDESRIGALRDRLEELLCLAVPDIVVNGDREHRLNHNLHVSVPGLPNDAIVARLRQHVAISTGASCASGTDGPSHVLRAMRLPGGVQEGALRIGLGKFNTATEIEQAAAHIAAAIRTVGASIHKENS